MSWNINIVFGKSKDSVGIVYLFGSIRGFVKVVVYVNGKLIGLMEGRDARFVKYFEVRLNWYKEWTSLDVGRLARWGWYEDDFDVRGNFYSKISDNVKVRVKNFGVVFLYKYVNGDDVELEFSLGGLFGNSYGVFSVNIIIRIEIIFYKLEYVFRVDILVVVKVVGYELIFSKCRIFIKEYEVVLDIGIMLMNNMVNCVLD